MGSAYLPAIIISCGILLMVAGVISNDIKFLKEGTGCEKYSFPDDENAYNIFEQGNDFFRMSSELINLHEDQSREGSVKLMEDHSVLLPFKVIDIPDEVLQIYGRTRYKARGTVIARLDEGWRSMLDVVNQRPLDDKLAFTVVDNLSAAVSYLASHGILHGNMKPEHLMYNVSNHRTVLTDVAGIKSSENPLIYNVGSGSPHQAIQNVQTDEKTFGFPLDWTTDVYGMSMCVGMMMWGPKLTDDNKAMLRAIRQPLLTKLKSHSSRSGENVPLPKAFYRRMNKYQMRRVQYLLSTSNLGKRQYGEKITPLYTSLKYLVLVCTALRQRPTIEDVRDFVEAMLIKEVSGASEFGVSENQPPQKLRSLINTFAKNVLKDVSDYGDKWLGPKIACLGRHSDEQISFWMQNKVLTECDSVQTCRELLHALIDSWWPVLLDSEGVLEVFTLSTLWQDTMADELLQDNKSITTEISKPNVVATLGQALRCKTCTNPPVSFETLLERCRK